MDKTIVVLDGFAEGKTKFTNIARQSGFWTWNINYRNILAKITQDYLGWDGDRNKTFYSFIDEFSSLADKYLDFENWYVSSMIEKFILNEKVNILFIHNCSKELSESIQKLYENCYNIVITNKDVEDDCNYCKTLNCTLDDYRDEVIKTLNIITNKKE